MSDFDKRRDFSTENLTGRMLRDAINMRKTSSSPSLQELMKQELEDDLMLNDDTDEAPTTRIGVMGVGGGGCNAVNYMFEKEPMENVGYICCNTDTTHLKLNVNSGILRFPLGKKLTRGQGAGMKPEIGQAAAEESVAALDAKIFPMYHMLFIALGLGGGTGTGAGPVIAKHAKKSGLQVVAVVTLPFDWEGEHRMMMALEGLQKLKDIADSIIVIPNDRLTKAVQGAENTAESVYHLANEQLFRATSSIINLILKPAAIKVDFQDVCTVLQHKGYSFMGYSEIRKVEEFQKAIQESLHNPVLGYTDLGHAKGALAMISSGANVSFNSVIEPVMRAIQKKCDPKVEMRFGHFYSEEMNDNIQITIIATGIPVDMDDFLTKPEEASKKLPPTRTKIPHREAAQQAHNEQDPSHFDPMSLTLDPYTQTTKTTQYNAKYSDKTEQFPKHDQDREEFHLEPFDPHNQRKTPPPPSATYRKPPTRPADNLSQSNPSRRIIKMTTLDAEAQKDTHSRKNRVHTRHSHSAPFIKSRNDRD